jgi:YggT family protein
MGEPSFIYPLLQVADMMLGLLSMMIVVYAMLSWFMPGNRHPVQRFLEGMVEPFLTPIRKVVPPMGGFDLSVMVALFLIYLVRSALLV